MYPTIHANKSGAVFSKTGYLRGRALLGPDVLHVLSDRLYIRQAIISFYRLRVVHVI